MQTNAAVDRFALLTRLPSLPSLDEKCAALAGAAYSSTPCVRATAAIFGQEHFQYAYAPEGAGIVLRGSTAELRAELLPSLEPFAVGGGYFVPRDAARAVPALAGYDGECDVAVVPLEARGALVGALLFEMTDRYDADALRSVRVFADLAAWMVAGNGASAAAREAKQSALLALINERASKSLDRFSILSAVTEDVRQSYGAMRCIVYVRDVEQAGWARVIVKAESADAPAALPESVRIEDTWLEQAFAGSAVGRESIAPGNPRDRVLSDMRAGSALLVPLAAEGRVDQAMVLHFSASHAFDEIDVVMMRSVASHIGLALANAQLYDLERVRRTRAESLERVVRMLRDTQTMEEVLLVFAVTVAHEAKVSCAVYEIERGIALRRAVRSVEPARGGLPDRADVSMLLPVLEREDLAPGSTLAPGFRAQLFDTNEGLIAALRIDGNLWGLIVFAAAPGTHDWADSERRLYFHMLAAHLELALSGALGFERIQQLARALSESNEFKDDLLAMLAHDFKGPLTVISGYCELLLEAADPAMRDELETIYSQTKRLVRLSEDAVALAQTQAGGFSLDRSVVDLREVAAESAKAYNRGEARIRVLSPGEPIMVALDTARFTHVLDNLLMNALKYSQGEVVVRLSRGDGNATIAINDRGIGIPAAELGMIFSRFGRASNARRKGISGSGVGLYVSRKIVEVHGGSIAVQSTEGEGSTFTVTLPLAGATHPPAERY